MRGTLLFYPRGRLPCRLITSHQLGTAIASENQKLDHIKPLWVIVSNQYYCCAFDGEFEAAIMNIPRFFSFNSIEPVNLSLKGKLIALGACFCAIWVIVSISQQLGSLYAQPMLVASMGATAVIVFMMPNSPLAQPWALLASQLTAAAIGVAAAQLIADPAWAGAVACAACLAVMLSLRCLHPPAAATALTPVIANSTAHPVTYDFVLMPVGVNVIVMLIMVVIINRWLLAHHSPSAVKPRAADNPEAPPRVGISEQDLQHALQKMDVFLDVSSADLGKLLALAKRQSLKRQHGPMTCADIMSPTGATVDYGTEVEDAWQLMCAQQLKALPVIDKAKRVIGIITWYDFVKCVNLQGKGTFTDKLLAFIRRTPDISTTKPEAVGHIMTRVVKVLRDNTHITELIPLMTRLGYRQIPIVNSEDRLVGMVYQANLIAALQEVDGGLVSR